MTIEEVMELVTRSNIRVKLNKAGTWQWKWEVQSITPDAGCVVLGEYTTEPEAIQAAGNFRKEELRAAILALLDAEAEACAEVCDAEDTLTSDYLAAHIRARIAARKGGAKP
jgi:hypothetical protein